MFSPPYMHTRRLIGRGLCFQHHRAKKPTGVNPRIGVLFGRCVFRFEDEKTQDPSPKDAPPPPPKHEDATLHPPAVRVSLAQAILSRFLCMCFEHTFMRHVCARRAWPFPQTTDVVHVTLPPRITVLV